MRTAVRNLTESYLEHTAGLRMDPDFLIIGTQRGGTTSLYRYLATHEGIAPTLVSKGVHYFDVGATRSPAWYRGHFPIRLYRTYRERIAGQRLLTGEASPYYLFHPAVPKRVHDLVPDVKLVVLLRDPVKRAYSHYHHEREGGFEDLETFEAAISAEEGRLAGTDPRLEDPAFVSFDHQHHSYVSRGLYAEQLERWLEHFPRERMLITTSEALYRDPTATWASVLSFLELPPRPLTVTKAYNAHRYDPIDPATHNALRERFEAPNARLRAMLGWDPGWS